MNNLRIVWLLPVAWFYWQPSLSEFTRLFPKTKIFTALFPGFGKDLEGTLQIEVVGKFKVIAMSQNNESYGDNFTNLSLSIISHLIHIKPQIIFSSSFGVWTIVALLLKPLFRWRVIIAYEGSSPGVDYRKSILRLSIRRFMIWLGDAYISNSQAGKTYLTDVLNAREDRTFVTPYEIPDERTLPNNTNSKLEDTELVISCLQHPVFLFVGHIIPRKGLFLLLQACTLLQAKGYSRYTVLVVGDGFQRSELESFCHEHNLESHIHWAGRVAYDQIRHYFQSSDVFVFPTLEDTWGVVTLEAMLLGKPILCSSGAGTAEMVLHGENGYIFAPNEPKQLADLMQTFLDNPETIRSMGERSKQIMAQCTPAAAAQCLAKVAELVMAS
jgi:glycosyltransferase involved in cell wall biosynthesis